MEVRLPDPHPGRCQNFRGDHRGTRRCLDREGHQSACVFPDPPTALEAGSWGHSGGQPEPVPWVPPWET